MRIGLLSDIHANLPALDVALSTLAREGATTYLSAGDLIGYGPHPAQCVDRLRELGALMVVGNHEQFLLERLPEQSMGSGALATLAWTRRVIGADRLAWLASLPERAALGPVLMTHATVTGTFEYLVRPRAFARQLELLESLHPASRVVVVGHTHQPTYCRQGERPHLLSRGGRTNVDGRRMLINPGSVGQSRQLERRPRARFALMDLEQQSVRWFAEPYDSSSVRRDLASANLPLGSIHYRPTIRRAVVRAVRTRTDLHLPWRRTGNN